MSEIGVQYSNVLNGLDSKMIKLKKPKGLFLLRKDINTILLLKKSPQLYQETVDLGVHNPNPILTRTQSQKNIMMRSFTKPFFNHNMKLIKSRTPKHEDKITLPKLIILNGKNNSPTILTSKNKPSDNKPLIVSNRKSKSPEKRNILSNETKMKFYSKSTRNIHSTELVFNL